MKAKLAKMTTQQITEYKQRCDDAYYNSGETLISDQEYDILKAEYIKRVKPDKVPVGAKIRDSDKRVNLPFWLGSADKMTPEDEGKLDRWIYKHKAPSFLISEKLDGVSCLLEVKNGKLSLYTRGDGEIGADITHIAKYLTIPKVDNDIYVRGELIMEKKTFESKHSSVYKNPRNMVAGLVGGKTARQGLDDIKFVAYEIVGDNMPKVESQLEALTEMKFDVVKYKVVSSVNMKTLISILTDFKKSSLFEIDGIIVQVNIPYDRNTEGNPDYMFAFKMLDLDSVREAIVEKIEWNVSKWGVLKPIVHIQPIEVSGITMSKLTGHNAAYIEQNNLGKGSILKVVRSKDVIPYILEVVQGSKAEMPEQPYTWDENHVNITTLEEGCETICIKLLNNFFSGLGIKYVSEATIGKLYQHGYDDLIKILSASKEDLMNIPTFQEKSAERIYTNLHEGFQNVSQAQILGLSGVLGFGIGERRMELLLNNIPDLMTVYKKLSRDETIRRIVQVEGFSDITAEKIVDNLKYGEILLEKLQPFMTLKKVEKISSSLQGMKIVMTGFRDKKLEEDIKLRGGQVVSSVSKNTSVLIVAGNDLSSSKAVSAQKLGVKIMNKDSFVSVYIN